MINDYLKIYTDDTLRLAKTLVIKSEDSADQLNDLIKLKYGSDAVDLHQPDTWKYYLNICGRYHPTDVAMAIVSLDTLEEISFTTENLLVHTATRQAYGFGSRYYYSLVDRYKDQEQLILGILYPASMAEAISSDNGSILSYPKELVEPQEITFIHELENWIKLYLVRWHIRAFGLSDTLYATAQHAIMYLNIVPKILNLRLRRCKTAEVHSFHIRQHLASHGKLDRYLNFMTLKQSLFFYRNITYIERHSGTKAMFKWLIDKLLSDRHFPIAEYSGRLISNFDDNYYPELQFRKKPLNTEFNVPAKSYYSLDEILYKEATLAPGNQLFIEDKTDYVNQLFVNSASSITQTKMLESSMNDYTDAVPYKLTDILLNQWAYMSSTGQYNVLVSFKDPRTSKPLSLYSDEAFIYMSYVAAKGIGIELTHVPNFAGIRVQTNIRPSVSDLVSLSDSCFTDIRDIAIDILNRQPIIKPCFSISSFFNLCNGIYDSGIKQWVAVSQTEHLYKRAIVQNMYTRLYSDLPIEFGDSGALFSQWLSTRGLPDTDFTADESNELATSIFNNSTGLVIEQERLIKNIQKAMLSMLGQLSSYSIQLIQEINDVGIRPINWAAIRIGDVAGVSISPYYVEANNRVLDALGVSNLSKQYEAIISKPGAITKEESSATFEIHRPIGMFSNIRYDITTPVAIHNLSMIAEYSGKDPLVSNAVGFIGFEQYLALSDEAKRDIVDIYHKPFNLGYSNSGISLNDSIPENNLPTP